MGGGNSDPVRRILAGEALSEAAAREFFEGVVRGVVDDIPLAAALGALKVRGETIDEMSGAVAALLASAQPFPSPDYAFADIVGTGGDGHNTINLSTISALVAACCGVKLAKHGNRSVSSCSGSFDLLDALGVDIHAAPDEARRQLDEHGICFLFAPDYHPGLRHAANVRKSLGVRTLFNLLGPLVNPARPTHLLLGVARPELLESMAHVLSRTGCRHAAVVHGSGVDEVAIHGSTAVVELADGEFRRYEVSPADFGTDPYPLDDLICSQAAASHDRSRRVLAGQGSDAENAAVAVNVAMLLRLTNGQPLETSFQQARQVLEAGQAAALVQRLGDSGGP